MFVRFAMHLGVESSAVELDISLDISLRLSQKTLQGG